MDNALNKEILRLSVPSILANMTVPLVGFVDTAVAGHLNGSAAAFIGAISVGALLFNLLYWNFGFLRAGTGGLTAQAFGRANPHDCAAILSRGLVLSLIIAAVLLAIGIPFMKLVLALTQASEEVESLASQYFRLRLWAAPATLSLMTFSGWFVGMQDTMSSMWKDFIVNGVNVVASIIFALGAGEWQGLGFAGIAMGTVVAQYSGLLFSILICVFKYRNSLFSHFSFNEMSFILDLKELKSFFKLNANLFGRSIFFTCIYVGYTMIAATMGDLLLACSSILMQMLLIFSYFTDGFAYAGEALTGRFIGAGNPVMMNRSVRYTFFWSMVTGLVFIALYATAGSHIVHLLSDDMSVALCCNKYLPWLYLMPPVGCAAFFWDGVFLGATASRGIRDAMICAAVGFFGVWFIGKSVGAGSLHLLLGAYMTHLFVRALFLTFAYPRQVVGIFLVSGIKYCRKD